MTLPTRGPARRLVLGQPRVRRLFLARTISQWGDTFNAVALVIAVLRLTGSGLQVALTVAFEVVPVLLLGFVAGAVVDRYSRQRVMVVADVGRVAVAVGLAVGHERLGVLYAAAFAFACFSVFFNPAASTLLPALVDDERDLVAANSAIWSAAVLSQIVLAPVAGALVAFAGPGPAFALNAASFAVSGLLLVGLDGPATSRRVTTRRIDEIREGLRAVRRNRLLSTLSWVQLLAALSAGATSALLVVLAEDHLDIGPGRFGWLLAAIGVGAGLGPMILRRAVDDVRRPGLLFGPYLLRGAVDAVLAATATFGVALGALGLYGVGTSVGNVTYQSTIQSVVPDRLRGRVFTFFDVVWQSARLVSIAGGGFLADRVGVRAVYALGGALLVAAGALGLIRVRQVTATTEGFPRGPTGPSSSPRGADGRADARRDRHGAAGGRPQSHG